MNKIISLALLIGGVALMIHGINAANSFSSDVARFFSGSPTDKAVWMLIGGTVIGIIGLASKLRSLETSLLELTRFAVAARTVGGQEQRFETTPANKE